MPEYFVRTNSDRVICVKADSYGLDYTQRFFDFKKGGNVLASFNTLDVLAIIDEEVFQGEFSAIDDEDETDDVCLDCRLQDFLESEDFFGEVWDIVEAWHAPDEDTPPEAEEPIPQAKGSIDPTYPVEHWKRYVTGDEWWGFQTPKGFVPFSFKDSAERNRHNVIKDLDGDWAYTDLTGYTKVED
jgi:hypothetical protein